MSLIRERIFFRDIAVNIFLAIDLRGEKEEEKKSKFKGDY
jgi:hypothetical protein